MNKGTEVQASILTLILVSVCINFAGLQLSIHKMKKGGWDSTGSLLSKVCSLVHKFWKITFEKRFSFLKLGNIVYFFSVDDFQ